jgi:hypothetical protein
MITLTFPWWAALLGLFLSGMVAQLGDQLGRQMHRRMSRWRAYRKDRREYRKISRAGA